MVSHSVNTVIEASRVWWRLQPLSRMESCRTKGSTRTSGALECCETAGTNPDHDRVERFVVLLRATGLIELDQPTS